MIIKSAPEMFQSSVFTKEMNNVCVIHREEIGPNLSARTTLPTHTEKRTTNDSLEL